MVATQERIQRPYEKQNDALTQRSSVKFDALTSLRFFAALSVLCLHSQSLGLVTLIGDNYTFLSLGHAVLFFFLLSGFVLTHRYESLDNSEKLRSYFWNRIGRILPLYYLTAIPYLLVPSLQHFVVAPIMEISSYLFALQDWSNDIRTLTPLNPPAHSVSSECFYYLLFPLLIVQNKRFLAPLTVLAVLLSAATWYAHCARGAIVCCPLEGLLFFIFGIWSRIVFPHVQHALGTQLSSTSRKCFFTIWELLSLAIMVVLSVKVSSLKQNDIVLRYLGYSFDCSSILIIALAFSFSLLLIAFATEQGLVSGFLKNKVLVNLGNASYALFLSHHIFLQSLKNISDDMPPYLLPYCWVMTCLLTIAVSFLLHLYVESPWRTLISKITSLPKNGNVKQKRSAFVELFQCMFLPTALVCMLVPLSLWYTRSSELRRWRHIDSPVINGSAGIHFGNDVELLGAKVTSEIGTRTLITFWKARQEIARDSFVLGTDVLSAKGIMIQDMDHCFVTSKIKYKGDVWQDRVILPNSKDISECGLALYDIATKRCQRIVGGQTDWNGLRLLIELPAK